MDDRKPVNLGVQEMEVSPNDSENSEDSVPENLLPLGSQALPSEMSAGPSSRASVVSETTERGGSLFGESRSSDCTPPLQSSSLRDMANKYLPRAKKTCATKNAPRARKTCTSRSRRQETNTSPMKRSLQAVIESTSPKKSKTEPTLTSRKRERMRSSSSECEDSRKQEELSSPSGEDALSERPLDEQAENEQEGEAEAEGEEDELEGEAEAEGEEDEQEEGEEDEQEEGEEDEQEGKAEGEQGEQEEGGAGAEGEQEEEEQPETVRRVSKYVSDARKLLLTIVDEIMDWYGEGDICQEFFNLFRSAIERSLTEDEAASLSNALQFYLEQKETYWDAPYAGNITLISEIKKDYYDLFLIVGVVAAHTVSEKASLEFDIIMANYKKFVILYRKFANYWKNVNLPNEEGNVPEDRVDVLREKIGRLLLQMKNAFRALLIHIGENAEEGIVSGYESTYLGDEDLIEDRSFLRRRIL